MEAINLNTNEEPQELKLSELANYLNTLWEKAKQAKYPIDMVLIECLRRKKK